MAEIEIEEFQLSSGVSPDAFAGIDERFLEWSHAHRTGLRRRTTARTGDTWLVLSWWDRVAAEPADGEEATAFRAAIDEATYQRRTYTTVG
jgi:hypothetical protein